MTAKIAMGLYYGRRSAATASIFDSAHGKLEYAFDNSKSVSRSR